MSERNIIAYFKTPEEAEGAKRKLESLRAIDVSVDRFSRYPGDGVDHVENPITSDFPSLGSLTLGADYSDNSAGILTATDVSASGMSDGGQGGPTGYDIILAAVVEDGVFNQAVQVVEQAGGKI